MNKAKIIKIIDLLQKIANNEELPKSIIDKDKFTYHLVYDKIDGYDYMTKGEDFNFSIFEHSEWGKLTNELNEEVVAIWGGEEPKKIDKLEFLDNSTDNEDILRMKINEIIEVVNELKEK